MENLKSLSPIHNLSRVLESIFKIEKIHSKPETCSYFCELSAIDHNDRTIPRKMDRNQKYDHIFRIIGVVERSITMIAPYPAKWIEIRNMIMFFELWGLSSDRAIDHSDRTIPRTNRSKSET